ncbi:MAG: uroporphyrinogen-III C-methyltransferase [Pseudomonadales bacterium]|nr:uroporphyrinogen-III C-methyltransferase [Pseudomonadales bacterium]MCP5171644.1 uroporphyrinogen-III C-methyltransferase [Pseudomonadales bacterium]
MHSLPLFHQLRGQRCVIVGGGDIALRKLRIVAETGAEVDVVAPDIDPEIESLADEHSNIRCSRQIFAPEQLDGAVLVIAATNDKGLNQRVSQLCLKRQIPVNVVDSPELCSVIFPAIVDRSPLQIAITSNGKAPVLARMLRTQLESTIPAGYGKLASLAGHFREAVKDKFKSVNERRKFWEKNLQGDIAELVFSGQTEEAELRLRERLSASSDQLCGEVYLVGGGPGDPDLLTFRALRLMQQADIVLYDRLVSKEVLNLVRRDADRIYVGKTAGDHPVSQENINEKLVEFAKAGKRVLRLKGGDPFIFGRGGEEIAHLSDNGIPFQVVPGITAASGCASYAGIPLTHRDHAQSVRFITGHLKDGSLSYNWPELIAPNQTLVFYMGLSGLENICQQLIAHGMASDTPAALIEKGATVRQRVFVGNLESLPGTVRAGEAKAPTLIIVGTVVSLRDKLAWFGDKTP